jgi:hypothetical protein
MSKRHDLSKIEKNYGFAKSMRINFARGYDNPGFWHQLLAEERLSDDVFLRLKQERIAEKGWNKGRKPKKAGDENQSSSRIDSQRLPRVHQPEGGPHLPKCQNQGRIQPSGPDTGTCDLPSIGDRLSSRHGNKYHQSIRPGEVEPQSRYEGPQDRFAESEAIDRAEVKIQRLCGRVAQLEVLVQEQQSALSMSKKAWKQAEMDRMTLLARIYALEGLAGITQHQVEIQSPVDLDNDPMSGPDPFPNWNQPLSKILGDQER